MTRIEAVDTVDIIRTDTIYRKAIDHGQPDGWIARIKRQNFDQLSRIAELCGKPLAGSSVLDVGCGTGDFYPYAMDQHVARYVGVDISEGVLEEARRKYPTGRFVWADIIGAKLEERFDYAVASGVFGLRQVGADNYDFMESLVASMWNMTNRGVAFNFLTDENEKQPFGLFFYNLPQVRALCYEVAPDAIVTVQPTPFFSSGDPIVTRSMTAYMIRQASPSTPASPGV